MKVNSPCLQGPSASSRAGGMATKRAATTSSHACRTSPRRGSTAKPANGSCMAFLPDYAELHCLSNFSFLRGASHPEELVERAAALGYAALALTDECSLAGVVRAHVAAKEHGLKLILGTELKLDAGLKVVLLATGRASYGAIAALITTGRRRSKKGCYQLCRDDLEAIRGKGVLVLLVCGNAEQASWIAGRFKGDAWLAVELHCGANDHAKLNELKALSEKSG